LGIGGRIEVQMGTLGKALGVSGGFICGSRALVDWLINRARSFIFSTAPMPATAAAAAAAIQLVASSKGEECRKRLWQRVQEFNPQVQSPIVPIILGGAQNAMDAAAALKQRGILAPAIRYPSVARGKARLRITFSASHTTQDVTDLRLALNHAGLQGDK
jgi:7-keto-8-aminopelargonate synthetase-like enzyme